MADYSKEQQIIALSMVLAGTKLKTADTLAELVVARKTIYDIAETLDELVDTVAQAQFVSTLK